MLRTAGLFCFTTTTLAANVNVGFWQNDWFDERQGCLRFSLHELCETYSQLNNRFTPNADGNGHLHTLAYNTHLEFEQWRFTLSPTLAASSNLVKHLSDADHRAWQWPIAISRDFAVADQAMQVGINYNVVLGSEKLYPSLTWQGHSANWQWQAGWPENRISLLADSLSFFLQHAPASRYWLVADEDRAHLSRIREQRWLTRLGVVYELNNIAMELSVEQAHQHHIWYEGDNNTYRLQPATDRYWLLVVNIDLE